MIEADALRPTWIRWTHLGLALFGVIAYLTGELAEDFSGLGYLFHAYMGMTLLVFIISRFVYGVVGQKVYRFRQWFPYRLSYLTSIKEDVQELFKGRLPLRHDHRGLSGLVQSFGLLVFAWMAISGTIMYFTNAGDESTLTELHEVGEGLIPLFLGLHIGAVALHMISGHNLLTKILPIGHKKKETPI